MNTRTLLMLFFAAALVSPLQGPMAQAQDAKPGSASTVKPLKVMLVTGGCCHDYAKQRYLLKEGLEARANVTVEMVHTDDKTTKARFPMYESANWAEGYDCVIHDECTSDVKDMPYVQNILNAHKSGVPAVNLHCAMHSYRIGTPEWFEFCGIQSARHGPQKPIEVKFLDKEHPITQPLADWTTINEELYNNLKVFDTAHPLARGRQDTGKGVDEYIVAWTNQLGKTRVFSTTLGHNNDTVADPRYLDLVTRGLLWSCDKLNPDYLKPSAK
jgi:type 1 glutamine amidotransferase